MRVSFHQAAIALALGLLLSPPSVSLGQAPDRTPAATTRYFAFYNDFATNLNDALLEAGRARNKSKPELFHSDPEKSCVSEMAPSARSAWNQAVDYYAEIISPADWNDRQQYLLRVHLAGFDEKLKDSRARGFAGVAENFRAVATSAYEACRWATQDAENRRWIEELEPRLVAHEQKIADRLQELYQKRWDGLIPVDVVETVNWSGATSQPLRPAGGHLLISNSYAGPAALEIAFHEASHLLMGRNDPLWRALEEAAGSLGRPLPDGLWHVVLFYTTGETVRRILSEAGEPEYTPMIYEIYGRSPWGRFRQAIDGTWPDYMNGERALSEVAADLIRAIDMSGEAKSE